MKRLHTNKLSVGIEVLIFTVIGITVIAEAFYFDKVEEYALTVNNEQLHFIAQPEAGCKRQSKRVPPGGTKMYRLICI